MHASYIKVSTYSSADTALTMRFGLIPTNNTTVVINTPDMVVNDRSKIWVTTGAIAKTVTHQAASNTIMGNKGLVVDDCSSLTSGSPTEDWYWHISYQSYDGSTSVTKYMDVQIVYDVEFFDKALQDTDLLETLAVYRAKWDQYKIKRATEIRERKQPEQKPAAPRTLLSAGAKEFKSLGFKETSVSIASGLDLRATAPVDSTPETKASGTKVPSAQESKGTSSSLLARRATQGEAVSFTDDGSLDDDDEAEFLQYLQSKRASRAMKQAHAFENSDFSGAGWPPTKKPG